VAVNYENTLCFVIVVAANYRQKFVSAPIEPTANKCRINLGLFECRQLFFRVCAVVGFLVVLSAECNHAIGVVMWLDVPRRIEMMPL